MKWTKAEELKAAVESGDVVEFRSPGLWLFRKKVLSSPNACDHSSFQRFARCVRADGEAIELLEIEKPKNGQKEKVCVLPVQQVMLVQVLTDEPKSFESLLAGKVGRILSPSEESKEKKPNAFSRVLSDVRSPSPSPLLFIPFV